MTADLVAEIDGLIGKIHAFHKDAGRKVAGKFRRRRKGRALGEMLSGFGFVPTPDLLALYHNWDGLECGDNMSQWESNVFLDFDWPTARQLGRMIHADRACGYREPSPHVMVATSHVRAGLYLRHCLTADHPHYGRLVVTKGLCRNSFVMFDDIVAMLRTVVAVQDAELATYDGEAGALHTDWASVARIAAEMNPASDYWARDLDGRLDWDSLSDAEIAELIETERRYFETQRQSR